MKTRYRIIEHENKAGGKRYNTQYQRTFLFGLVKYWQYFKYYDNTQELIDRESSFSDYTEYCNAINAIKYHKMFGKDKSRKYIHEIND